MQNNKSPLNAGELQQIVEKARKFDKEAFSMIYNSYYNRIFRYAYFKIGSQEDAEDITQNTFIAALKSIANFRWKTSDEDFTAWLFSLAHNNYVDYYRKNKINKTKPFEDLQENKSEFDELIQKIGNIDLLKQAINKIKHNQRQVVILRYINDMPISQTAMLMNKTEGAIKLLQLRALASLKKILGGETSER